MKRIAFLTDIHLNEQFPVDNGVNSYANFERVLADLNDRNINDIIFGGDIGDVTSHNYFFDKLKLYSLKLFLGNHDKFVNVTKYFKQDKNRSELYYEIEDEFYKYLFLDTSSDVLSNQQLVWLESELTTNKKIILFIHHPVIEIDTPVDKLYPLKNRDQLKSILEKNENSITIFCGHYHMNDELTYKNIKQITTQSLSFQLVKNAAELMVDNSKFGYRIITVDNENVTTEPIDFETK